MYLQEIQSKHADGIGSSTPLSSEEYQELQRLRATLPKLLVQINELRVQFDNLRKKREESEAKTEHMLLRVQTIETELSTSASQTASIHEWYRDRDQRILCTLAECVECLYGRQSAAADDAATPSLEELLRRKLPSLFNEANTYFGDSHAPALSVHHHDDRQTSDISFMHSAEQPIPIPLPGSDIGSTITHINHPAAPPVSHSSNAITPSNQTEDEALGDTGGQ